MLVIGLASCGAGEHRQQPVKPTTASEEHVRRLIQSLPVDSRVRENLEGGGRGDGVHYSWMDDLRKAGVKRVEVGLKFNVGFRIPYVYLGRPSNIKVDGITYYFKYDYDCAQIIDSERLEAIRSSGLEEKLKRFAIAEVKGAHWFHLDRIAGSAHGGSTVELVDDEWVPRFGTRLHTESEQTWPPLLSAILAHDEAEVARVLASRKVSKAELDDDVIAAAAEDSCILKRLLKAGADPNVQNNDGESVLVNAVQSDNVNSVKALLEAGVDLNAKTLD